MSDDDAPLVRAVRRFVSGDPDRDPVIIDRVRLLRLLDLAEEAIRLREAMDAANDCIGVWVEKATTLRAENEKLRAVRDAAIVVTRRKEIEHLTVDLRAALDAAKEK